MSVYHFHSSGTTDTEKSSDDAGERSELELEVVDHDADRPGAENADEDAVEGPAVEKDVERALVSIARRGRRDGGVTGSFLMMGR